MIQPLRLQDTNLMPVLQDKKCSTLREPLKLFIMEGVAKQCKTCEVEVLDSWPARDWLFALLLLSVQSVSNTNAWQRSLLVVAIHCIELKHV